MVKYLTETLAYTEFKRKIIIILLKCILHSINILLMRIEDVSKKGHKLSAASIVTAY